MTQGEFSAGWKLLILQPWGWRYRSLTRDGTPSAESKTQLEFYYHKLQWAHPDAWMTVADLFAQGDDWPSVKALQQALKTVNPRHVTSLTDRTRDTAGPPPPEVLALLQRIGRGKAMPT